MTHRLPHRLPTIAALLLTACAGGRADATDPDDASDLGVPPSVSSPDDGTQVGGEGTQPTTTCTPADGLPLDTVFDDGSTVEDALAVVDLGPGTPLWFDGRGSAITLSVVPGSEVAIDGYCHHLVQADIVVESDDGAVYVEAPVTLLVIPGYVTAQLDQPATDWAGSLDEVEVLGEACVEGSVWRTTLRWIEDMHDGGVSVRCNPWSAGGGEDGTTPIDSGTTDTGGTDGGSTGTAVPLTGTTTAPNTGGEGDDPTDPQLGHAQHVVDW